MKKLRRWMICFLSICLLCLSHVFAQDDHIQITQTNIESSHAISIDLDQALPGDDFSKRVMVENDFHGMVDLYLRMDCQDDPLLEKIKLSLVYNGKEIYNGTLQDAVYNAVKLDTLNDQEKKILQWNIHIPEELDNAYNMSYASLDWILYAEYQMADVKTGNDNLANIFLLTAIGSGMSILMLVIWHLKRKEGENSYEIEKIH